MSFNLFLDSTRDTLMLALAQDEQVLFTVNEPHTSQRYHSAILLPKIQEALRQFALTPQDLTSVGVNIGPGSFTGIRTGLTVVRLMGQFLPVSTYGFNTFELIAGDISCRGRTVTVLLNAFRQQHYLAALEVGNHGEITWLSEPQVRRNEHPLPVQTDLCIVDGSLEGKLGVHHPNPQRLEEMSLFTPDVMRFYLMHHPERYLRPWSDLKPLYLQLPHITVPKAKQCS